MAGAHGGGRGAGHRARGPSVRHAAGDVEPDTCARAGAPLRTGTRPQSHHVGGAR